MVKARGRSARWWALGAVSLSVLTVSLDGTVLAVALPTLARELDASQTELVWFSAGYLLVLAAATLPVGLLGDRIGRKKVMLSSVAIFGVGSLICSYSTSAGMFLAGRLMQGLAGAGVTVMALSALIVLFDEKERPQAVGIYQAVNFIGLPLGPILGGWMLSHFWWGWVFLINVPVVVLALVVGFVLIPESRASQRPGLDPVGTAASVLGLSLVVYGAIQAGENGWTPLVMVALAAGVMAVVGFVVWERHLGQWPGGRSLIDPALFASRTFIGGAILAAVAGLAMIGVLFTMPQYFQGVQDIDTLGSGVRLLPLIGGMILGAGVSGRLVPAIGARLTVLLGFLALAVGSAVGTFTRVDSPTAFVGGWLAVVGLGTGLTLAAATATALSGLSAERSGTESAVVQAFNKTSGPLGTALIGSVLVAGYQSRLDVAGVPESLVETAQRSLYDGLAVADQLGLPTLQTAAQTAFVDGLRMALWVSAAIAAVGAFTAVVILPRRIADNGLAETTIGDLADATDER